MTFHPEPLESRLCLSAESALAQLPMSFEPNVGQAAPGVAFVAHGPGYTASLSATRVSVATRAGDVVGMALVGARPGTHGQAVEPLASRTNYLTGNDPSRWRTDVTNYGGVVYRHVYAGIDASYHGTRGELEYDLIVTPGASTQPVTLRFSGTTGRTLDAQGNLILHTSSGDLVEHAPVAYQEYGGTRHTVQARYVLKANGTVGFAVEAYNHASPLIIDPTLSYSTFLGSNGTDQALAVATDAQGNAYVAGLTASSTFPTTRGSLQTKMSGGEDAFVAKFSPTGALVYSTFLGGSGTEWAGGIAVDSAGNAYVSGVTNSTNFPTKNAFQAAYGGGASDAFLAKLNASGSALIYATYIGGSGVEDSTIGGPRPTPIAIDPSGNAYLAGNTTSTNYPVTSGAFQTAFGGARDGTVTKINTTLAGPASLVSSTYLGGSGNIYINGIALDSAGDAFVAGSAQQGFPTTAGSFQPTFPGLANNSAFVTKLNPTDTGLVYSTYLGGTGGDTFGGGIAVDGSGNAVVTGYTWTSNFPIVNGFQTVSGGSVDGFVSRLDAQGQGLLYSSYLGGSSNDDFYQDGWPMASVALDSAGMIYLAGVTNSTDFPTRNPFLTNAPQNQNAFVMKVDPGQSGSSSLVHSTVFGGDGSDYGTGIAVDPSGNIYLVGYTDSGTNFPIKNAYQSRFKGAYDAFLAKITP